MYHRHFRLPAIIVALGSIACVTTVLAAETPIDDDIIRLRKELSRQQTESQRIKTDIDREQKDFVAYQKNIEQRTRSLLTTMDSTRQDITRATRKNDSLAAHLASQSNTIRQIELTQETTRQEIVSACTGLETIIGRMPPLTAQSLIAALALLKSDLAGKSIDNIEGANRLYTILTRLEEAAGMIVVSQENSPVADIRGTVYRIRLGNFFEGAVDEKGAKGVIFTGYAPDGSPQWKTADAGLAAALYSAAVIREGKSLPAFVRLPLGITPDKGAQ